MKNINPKRTTLIPFSKTLMRWVIAFFRSNHNREFDRLKDFISS